MMKANMKLLSVLLICVALACTKKGVKSVLVEGTSTPAKLTTSNETSVAPNLTAQSARRAIMAFIKAHPDVFVSPGRKETLEEIQKVNVPSISTGGASIGLFAVNLDENNYQLIHTYGKSGSGWFEDWFWKGDFKFNSGTWEMAKPEFLKMWGE